MSDSEKKKERKNPNAGHRQRMRERLGKHGLENFHSHEVLELLLFYSLPRVNTNPIAHALLDEFHSLSAVLDADVTDLKRVKGINDNTALFLHMLPELFRLYQIDKQKETKVLDTTQKLMDFVKSQLTALTTERLLLISLDESLHLISCDMISEGTTQETQLDVHRIVECAIRRQSFCVVLAHNHPNAEAVFSDADIFATECLRRSMNNLKIKLIDHIVVGKYNDAVSMRQTTGWEN